MEKMIYDAEDDILSLSGGRKIKSSIDIDDFIIDIDHRRLVCGMEILNASQNLGFTKAQLNSMKKADITVTYKPNYVFLSIIIKLGNKEKSIKIPLAIDLGHREMKTEKTIYAVA
jgi:uncharacterized protein YuzE